MNELQRGARAAAQPTRQSPFTQTGVIVSEETAGVEGISFTAGVDKTITHGLGKRPKYVVVLSARDGYASAPIRTDQTDELDAQSIVLRFQNTTRVILWLGGV